MSFAGAVPADALIDIIERVMQPALLTETAAPEAGPVTPASQPGGAPAGGKIILP
jgi:hypothetical protein